MATYVYIYICTYIHLHIFTYIHIYVFTFVHVHMYLHVHIYIYICTNIYLYIFTFSYIFIQMIFLGIYILYAFIYTHVCFAVDASSGMKYGVIYFVDWIFYAQYLKIKWPNSILGWDIGLYPQS